MAVPPRGGKWPAGHDRLAKAAGFDSWAHWIVELEKAAGRIICGGKKPSDGTPCRAHPAKGAHRCARTHNGNAVSGVAHPAYEGKGYSKVLDLPRGAKVEHVLQTAELVSVREELAVAAVLHSDLLLELQSLEAGGATFEDLRDSFAEIAEAVERNRPEAVAEALKVHRSLLASGLDASRLRDEIRKSGDHIGRLARIEQRRSETLEASLPRQQVLGLLAFFVDRLRAGVAEGLSGPELLRAQARELRRLVSPGAAEEDDEESEGVA